MIRLLLLATLSVLSLTGFSHAAVRITGPASCAVGKLTELRAVSDIPKAAVTWMTAATFDYRSYELKGGEAVVLFVADKSGVYEFACVELSVGPDGTPAFNVTKHRIEVTNSPQPGPGPNPTPVPPNPTPPNPGPGPQPPAPNDQWGLAKISRETAPPNADERAKVRKNYETAASRLIAGGFSNIDQAYESLRQANRAAVGNPATQGHPWNRFAFATAERMDQCEAEGTLRRTPGDYAAAWTAIAKGLE